jgi:hypothetical protein
MTETSDIIAILRTALPDLRRQWPIRSLALFGSRVRNDATPDSDLDVLVEFTRPIALSSFLALEDTAGRSRVGGGTQALYRRARASRGSRSVTAARDYRDFLNDMVLACRSIIRFADGMTLDEYLADEKTRYAVMRAYEILGEAARHDLKPLLPRLEALGRVHWTAP